MKTKILMVLVGLALCGCSSVTKEQAQTVVAYQTEATVFVRQLKSTSTALVSTAESLQLTLTEFYKPTATFTITPTPSITPTFTPTNTDTPIPQPSYKIVVVTTDQSPLRWSSKNNQAGKPIMVIYKFSGGRRYIFVSGQKVKVYPWKVIADGGHIYWKVVPGQSDGFGNMVPGNPAMYILGRHVTEQ